MRHSGFVTPGIWFVDDASIFLTVKITGNGRAGSSLVVWRSGPPGATHVFGLQVVNFRQFPMNPRPSAVNVFVCRSLAPDCCGTAGVFKLSILPILAILAIFQSPTIPPEMIGFSAP
jgi:hypothetical protein